MRAKRPAVQIDIGPRPIRLEPLTRLMEDPASGAVSVFVGRVRAERGSGKDFALRYEAYEPLARKTLEGFSRTALTKHGARKVLIQHRTGILRVGEPSVLVAVAAAHRKEAFVACRYLIDSLKKEAPIWKTPVRRGAR